jgi:hypothetical protein
MAERKDTKKAAPELAAQADDVEPQADGTPPGGFDDDDDFDGEGPNGGGGVGPAVRDLGAYPFLTESYPFSGYGGAPGAPGTSLGATAATAIGDVLGWKWRPSSPDPRAFAGALTQAFRLFDVEGHTESEWRPRTYAVQTDLSGGISGAQASVYARAQEALTSSLPLLEGLYPLRLDADPEDTSALKAMIRQQASELVAELGVSGGPRVLRVNNYFRLLLGKLDEGRVQFDPDQVLGHVGRLRDELGLGSSGELVNTVEEEQDVTNFRILADYLTGLRQSWQNNRDFFLRGQDDTHPFFGTQLVLLSRQLAVVADSVESVRRIMGSVFISDAERNTLSLELKNPWQQGKTNFMLVEELLSWVAAFASDEGPALIRDSGKLGVQESFHQIAESLRDLVRSAVRPENEDHLPSGYTQPRVRRAMRELASQLRELAKLADPLKHSTLSQD